MGCYGSASMTVEKTLVQIGTTEQIGVRLEDEHEKAQARAATAEGRIEGLQVAHECLVRLVQQLQKTIDEGKLPLPEELTVLTMGDTIKRWMMHLDQALEANVRKTSAEAKIARGVAEGLKQSVQVVVQHRATLQQKAQHADTEALEEKGRARAEGAHPGPTEKQKRRAKVEPPPPSEG